MRDHPGSVAVFMTDIEGQMFMPDGSTEQFAESASKAVVNPAGEQLLKNTSSRSLRLTDPRTRFREGGGCYV